MIYDGYESDKQIVIEELQKEGIQNYTLYPANNCVGVASGRLSMYYIVRDGKVIDKQID